ERADRGGFRPDQDCEGETAPQYPSCRHDLHLFAPANRDFPGFSRPGAGPALRRRPIPVKCAPIVAIASPGFLRTAQPYQHGLRGEAVRNEAGRGLEVADGGASLGTEAPVGVADIETAPRQMLLHLHALLQRERALLARP